MYIYSLWTMSRYGTYVLCVPQPQHVAPIFSIDEEIKSRDQRLSTNPRTRELQKLVFSTTLGSSNLIIYNLFTSLEPKKIRTNIWGAYLWAVFMRKLFLNIQSLFTANLPILLNFLIYLYLH